MGQTAASGREMMDKILFLLGYFLHKKQLPPYAGGRLPQEEAPDMGKSPHSAGVLPGGGTKESPRVSRGFPVKSGQRQDMTDAAAGRTGQEGDPPPGG